MSKSIYNLAFKHYVKDGDWPKSYVDQLYAKKKLTKTEYEELLAAKGRETQ